MMVTEGTEPSNFLHKVEFDLHIYLFFSGKRTLHFTVTPVLYLSITIV